MSSPPNRYTRMNARSVLGLVRQLSGDPNRFSTRTTPGWRRCGRYPARLQEGFDAIISVIQSLGLNRVRIRSIRAFLKNLALTKPYTTAYQTTSDIESKPFFRNSTTDRLGPVPPTRHPT